MGIARKDWCGKAISVWCDPTDLAMAWPEMYEVLLENISKIPHVKDGRGGYRPRKNKPNKQDVSNETRVKTDTTVCEHVWDEGGQVCIPCGAFRLI